MPTEKERPGMFARRAKILQKSTKPPHDGDLAKTIRKQQTLGADLAQMTDHEIMKILMDTARYLVKIQWGAVGLGYVATSTGTPVESEGFGSNLYVTNPSRSSVSSERSMLLEFPAVAEIEGTPAHPVAFGEKDLEGMILRVDERQVEGGEQMMVQQMPIHQTPAQPILVQRQVAPFASALLGPPEIIVIGAEHNHQYNSFQRQDSPDRRNAIPEGSPPPIPLKSKPKPTHTERRVATSARHNPNPPSFDPPLNASTPNIRRPGSSNRRSVSDELHFPQQPPPTPQQVRMPNNTRATPPPPIRITPSPDSYLTVPDPSVHRPRHTKNRPIPRERPPPY